MKSPIVRYIVEHKHQAYESAPVEDAVVSYNNHYKNGSITALSLAIHTASRYKGVIYSENVAGEKQVVKDYRPKA